MLTLPSASIFAPPNVHTREHENSLQKWSESIGNCHQNIGCFEPEHIGKEVIGEFAIPSVVARVTGKSSYNHYEEDKNV